MADRCCGACAATTNSPRLTGAGPSHPDVQPLVHSTGNVDMQLGSSYRVIGEHRVIAAIDLGDLPADRLCGAEVPHRVLSATNQELPTGVVRHRLDYLGEVKQRGQPDRVISMMCHVGGSTRPHRLHRAGDRQANSALWRIALAHMGSHQPTKDYVARRTTEGKTKTEIMRCLKRYIAREVFSHLLTV